MSKSKIYPVRAVPRIWDEVVGAKALHGPKAGQPVSGKVVAVGCKGAAEWKLSTGYHIARNVECDVLRKS